MKDIDAHLILILVKLCELLNSFLSKGMPSRKWVGLTSQIIFPSTLEPSNPILVTFGLDEILSHTIRVTTQRCLTWIFQNVPLSSKDLGLWKR